MPCSMHAKMEFNHQKSVEINKDLVVVAITAAADAADATACLFWGERILNAETFIFLLTQDCLVSFFFSWLCLKVFLFSLYN